MEYRKRTLSSALDDDIETQIPRRRGTSVSIDDQLDEYTIYVYTGTFNILNSITCGLIKLICPCCFRNRGSNTAKLSTISLE
jgi:hypothetical protein